MTKFITKTVEYVFILLLALILLAMSISLAETVFNGLIAVILGFAILAFIFSSILFFRKTIDLIFKSIYTYLSKIPSWKLALILGLFSAVTKVILVFVFDNNAALHPDMAMYRSFAEQYANSGSIAEHATYASKFEYTTIYGFILSPFAKLFGANTKVFTVILSILHSIAMVLLYDILKHYCKKETAFATLLLYCASPMGLLQTQLLTHENGLLFFHVLALWIFLKAFDNKYTFSKQLIFMIASSLILCIGKSINAAGRVFVISFGIYAFLKIFENGFDSKKIKKFACIIVSLLLCYAATSSATHAIINSTVEDTGESEDVNFRLAYGWPLYIGFNYETNGSWNANDRDTYELYNQFDNKDEAYDYQKSLIKARIETYKESPIKIPILFFKKIKVLWGTQLLPFSYELGNSANDFVLYGFGGIINKLCIFVNCSLFLLLYTYIFITKVKSLKNKTASKVTPILHCQMSIIGVTLALLLFEVTPKYASHLHIMFFCIFALAFNSSSKKEIFKTK